MAAKRLPRLNGFWLLSVLIGVLLLVSISFYSANTDIATAEDALSTRVDYIKEQCADYSSLNLASEAKSLLRVTESAQQCARDIWYLTEKPDDLYPAAEDVLPHFVENHYLTGLLLLSRDGQITKSYCKEEALLPLLNKVLTTDSLLDVAEAAKAEAKKPKQTRKTTQKQKKPSIRAQLAAAKEEQKKKPPAREKSKEMEV